MTVETSDSPAGIRFEADEKPPASLSAGLGLQLAILTIAGIVFTPAIVVRAAGGSEAYLSWAVFAAVAISGLTTILQAVRVGRFGAGYVLLMGTSGAFIAVCIAAIAKAGPAMLATLVVISSFFQFALAGRLRWFRRILTPAVSGTVIMLIAVTVMPIVFKTMNEVPEGSPASAGPLSALVTILIIAGIALKANGPLRLWAPVIGIVVGTVFASVLGLYDAQRVSEAAWVGLPQGSWPGFDLGFGGVFWALLPAFIFVTLIGAVETIGDSVAIQRVSWRRPRAVDYRAVQGALSADGVGNLLSGLAGTVPNTTYSTSIAATELTGVAARIVGIAAGIVFLILAFLPKALALILAIPAPVVGAYVTVLIAMLFVIGMKIVIQDGVDYRKGLIVGIAFWVGVGFQNELIFPSVTSAFAGGLLNNGMTAGGLVAIIMTAFVELTAPRRSSMTSLLDPSALPKIREFLAGHIERSSLDPSMTTRLEAAAEETLLTLHESDASSTDSGPRHLQITAYAEGGAVVLEFVAAANEDNLQDQIALLGERSSGGAPAEDGFSLRILEHLASSIRHQQFHDTDVITLKVKGPGDSPILST